ncbi:MAG: hypothetical protein K6F73_03815 [Lachnospiraceae bacterium]|nr:hypothetical protein [Lachnospiraceae bacterium]
MKRTKIIAAIALAVLILLGFTYVSIEAGERKDEKPAGNAAFSGTWQLSPYNDQEMLDGAFPDIYAFGSELTIRPDGKIYWHIGAAGAAGTYESYGNQLMAQVSDIMEYDEYRIAVTADEDGNLLMNYKSVPLKWTYRSGAYQ